MQRLLARFGYVRLTDHGLVMTQYGVVVRQAPWQRSSTPMPYGAPEGSFGPVDPTQESTRPHVRARGSLADELFASDTECDIGSDTSTLIQPLANYHLPLPATERSMSRTPHDTDTTIVEITPRFTTPNS